MKKRKVQVDEFGPEPKWESKSDCSKLDIVLALNWYNGTKTDKDAAKYLGVPIEFARRYMSVAWIHRMVTMRGFILNHDYWVGYQSRMESLKQEIRLAKKLKVVDTPKVSIQDRITAKTDQYIGEMEGLVDDFGIHGDYHNMDAYKWMVDNGVKAIHANKIAEHFREEAREVYEALNGKNEAYESVSKKRMMNMLKCFAAIIKDSETLSQNANKTRKPRKKKITSINKQIEKLNYLDKYDPLQLQSIAPVKIIGAINLWVYNVKTRKLGFYVSMDSSGLSAKGSTLQNFSQGSSISKTLRKPEVVLPAVVAGSKVGLRKVMDDIKAKAAPLTGRINKDTVLLRIA